MNLGDNKGIKIAEPFFLEKFSFCPNFAKRAKKWPFWAKMAVFGTFEKNDSTKFSKIPIKVGKNEFYMME